MALSFQNANGNLFNRLGKLGLAIKQMRTYQNSQVTNIIGANPPGGTPTALTGQFTSEPSIQALIGSSYASLLNSPGSIGSFMASIARETVSRMVYRDNPRIGQTLESQNVPDSLNEIIRQMKGVQGGQAPRATVLAHATRTAVWTDPEGGTTAKFYNPTFSPSGNGVIVTSVIRPYDGLTLQNAFAETVKVECSADSFASGATAGNESFNVTGQGAQGDFFAFDWPLGSDCRTSVSAIDGTKNNASGNKLNNSGFDSFTGDAPNKFTIVVGTPGTHIFKETSQVMTGGSALRFLGTATANLTEIKQQFNSSNGTTDTLAPLTQYSFNIFVKRDGSSSIPAGTAVIDLVDASNAVILDANGNPGSNSLTIDLTAAGITGTYSPQSFMIRTPLVMPSSYFWRLRLSTAITNTRSVYFDLGSLGLAKQLYTSGDYLAIHAGSIPFRLGDYSHVVVSNGRGAAGTLDTFQTLLARLFPSEVYDGELIFPYAASPSLSDTALIA